MHQPIHILSQMGVLHSFSVAKKITEEDINKYFSKYKKSGRTDQQIGEMLKEKIVSEINDAVNNNQIPGLLSVTDLAKSMGADPKLVEKIPDLNRLVMILSQKMLEKKYDKMSLCYFINSLVNILQLTEEDFSKFHQQNMDGSQSSDDDDDDNDDEA